MFQLDSKSPKSIYEQVIDNIKALIMSDVLVEGTKLPSVRELSRKLTINPNTVQKAFRELERQGYTYTVSGRGTFVANKGNIKVDQEAIKEVQRQVAESYQQLRYLGTESSEAKQLCIDAIDQASEPSDRKGEER